MKNWKTTVSGIIAAVVLAIHEFNEPNPSVEKLVGAGLIAALGYYAKDHDVTGGTIKQ
jgi:hypothetical protein